MSNDKQQTAVEWFEKETRKPEWHSLKRGDILEQAKEMEKKQIKNAYNDGHTDGFTAKPGLTSGTMYYNETYGGGEQ
jgi:hypothetical protein